MQKLSLVAGSTGELNYTPTEPDDVTTITVELYDENNVAVPTTVLTEGADDVWRCTVEHSDIPVASIGEEWSGAFIVELLIDGDVQYRRKPFTIDIVADIGATTLTVATNTYVTYNEAVDYMQARLGTSAWDDAAPTYQESALLMAARRIDALPLRGVKYDDENQTMQFPRYIWGQGEQMYSEEHERYSSMYKMIGWFGDGVVPQSVKDAQCEEALAILAADAASSTTDRETLQAQGVTSVKIGDFSETYGGGGASTAFSKTNQLRSIDAMALLRPYILGAVAVS